MAMKSDPSPREKILRSSYGSPMQFMKEELIPDEETSALVRFRGPFIMPDWQDVEENEFEYVVQESWKRLDSIAHEVYGDVHMMWVIAARNHMDLPSAQVYKGQKLKLPNRAWVESKLLPQGRTLRSN